MRLPVEDFLSLVLKRCKNTKVSAVFTTYEVQPSVNLSWLKNEVSSVLKFNLDSSFRQESVSLAGSGGLNSENVDAQFSPPGRTKHSSILNRQHCAVNQTTKTLPASSILITNVLALLALL